MAYRHVVLFRFRDHVSDDDVEACERRLLSLADHPGVESFGVHRSEDTRKGRVVLEEVTFTDRDAYAAWRAWPEHVAAGEQLSEVADWWVADHPLV